MQDLFECLRYYFFVFDKLVVGFFTWTVLVFKIGGLVTLLECCVFILENGLELLLNYLNYFLPPRLVVSGLRFPYVFNLLGIGYYWSGKVNKIFDFFFDFIFLLDLAFLGYSWCIGGS